MKKILFAFASLLFCLTPALAQRGHDHQREGMRDNRQFHNNQHFDRREPREHREAIQKDHDSYRGHHEERDRWDGRRFDRDFVQRRFGRDHRFYWYHCRWYGPRFHPGSRFWYSGAWFVIVDTIPDYWGDGEVYVEEIDGEYYLMNPAYPGARIYVHVVF